jgi:hypothetical protein
MSLLSGSFNAPAVMSALYRIWLNRSCQSSAGGGRALNRFILIHWIRRCTCESGRRASQLGPSRHRAIPPTGAGAELWAQQKLARDQPGFHGLAETNVVRDQKIDARKQRLAKRQELVGVEPDAGPGTALVADRGGITLPRKQGRGRSQARSSDGSDWSDADQPA